MHSVHSNHRRSHVSRRRTHVLWALLSLVALCGVLPAQSNSDAFDANAKRPIHIVPITNPNQPRTNVIKTAGLLHYYGGPVISNPDVIIVNWGAVSKPVGTGGVTMANFLQDVTNTTYWDMLSEYNTAGMVVGAHTGNQTIGRGTFNTEITITPTVCTATTCTDAQIQSELNSQITAGHLPEPTVDANGHSNTIYMIYFPSGFVIKLDASDTSCVQFCAYHSTANRSGVDLLYGIFPDLTNPGCDGGCGAGATDFDNLTSVSSHELVEATTDAEVGYASTVAYPIAWYNTSQGEISDICNAQQTPLDTARATYTVQKQYSNLAGVCTASTANSATSFALSAPSTVAAGVPFNVTVTAKNSSSATTAAYGGTVHYTSSDGSSTLPADGKLTSGVSTIQVTLHTLGAQSITAADVNQPGITGLANVTVTASSSATMTSPANGSTLSGSSTTFNWSPGSGATQFSLYVGTAPGAHDVFFSTFPTSTTSTTVNSIPTHGAYLYVTLYSYYSGAWHPNSYRYIESGTPVPATMATPSNGAVLAGTSQSFTWNAGVGANNFSLYVGTAPGAHDIAYQTFGSATTSTTVSGLPTNAQPVYVTLYSYIAGTWRGNSYKYYASGTTAPATIATPTPGSTLSSASQSFTWTAGTAVLQYSLYVGTTPGAHDVFYGTFNPGTTSTTVSSIPTTGATLYVRLNSFTQGTWQSESYTYTEAGP
ncbi:hypothetical protein Acid345_2079 [Candidatus Koribacter versatilis Ellin345]|uniref:Uncharacterized protein n=1 Tax=Koribacter versatilis (strain Ellin345) TaxID=204669 RepID=Q1IPX0_KORVE|nr:hypothetical protein [Candidatus Koribacter versatilis]ABF41080.1 hypothetical protein Acid345_2079 [Candidatus Koribacter versatilis Ellin345]